MARRTPAAKDLSVADFKRKLAAHGFAYNRQTGGFIDLRRNKAERFQRLLAIRDDRNRIMRRETLAALLEARAQRQAAHARAMAEAAERERVATTLAPQAIPPCRADLDGAAAVAQLADDFLLGCTTEDGISFKSLIQKGWRADQLTAYADQARTVADRRQVAEAA